MQKDLGRAISSQIHVQATDHFKDVETARFTPCFMPVVTAAPAVIAALILLSYSFRIFEAYKPRWMKPFVQETKKEVEDLDAASRHHPLAATLSLLVIVGIGLALQIITIFLPERQVIEMYPSIAWVCQSYTFDGRTATYKVTRALLLSLL